MNFNKNKKLFFKEILRESFLALIIFLLSFAACWTIPTYASKASTDNWGEMHGKEDVFSGKFSSQSVNVSVGQAFEVSFAIAPVIDMSHVVIRLIVPEGLMRLLEGDEAWRGEVKKGEVVERTYSIVADEEVDEYISVEVEGRLSDRSYSSSYGLRVTTPMNPVYLEESSERYVPMKQLSSPIGLKESSYIDQNLKSQKKIRIKGIAWYQDDDGHLKPMRRVKVWLKDDEPGRPDEEVAWQHTDDAGRFDFTVKNDDGTLQDGRDPYVEVEAINTVAVCKEGYTDTRPYYMQLDKAGSDVPNGFVYDYGIVYPSSKNEAWQAIDYCLTEADWIRSRVSWGRPKINIYWPKGDWPFFVGFLGSTIEHIRLPNSFTRDNVYHEYGHAVMYQLYGNSWIDFEIDPPDHNPVFEYTGGFALQEGWAEFMECAVSNDPEALSWGSGDIETNNWYNQEDAGQMDGNHVEGSVASILWDIFDPVSVADRDGMDWGFEEIFYILRNGRPENMEEFWLHWKGCYPSRYTSVGPLSTIFWNYGIDKDQYQPEILDPDTLIYSDSGEYVEQYSPSTQVTIKFYTMEYSGGHPPRVRDNTRDYGSGIAYMRFRNSPTSPWSDWRPYENETPWTLSTGDGKKYVYVQLRDNKGLLSKIYSDSIILDTTPPKGSIIINSGNPAYTYSRSVKLYLTYSDAFSGVEMVRYSNDGVWDTEGWEGLSRTKNWILSPGDGVKIVYYQIRDRSGLISTCSDEIIMDENKPAPVLVIRGTDNKIYYNVGKRDGGWTGWINLPGKTTDTSPAAEVMDDDLHVVVRGRGGVLWHGHVSLVTKVFSGWKKILGTTTPSPPALTTGHGGLILVVRGEDDRIYYNTWNRISWGDWDALPGATDQAPAAIAVGLSNRSWLHIVIRGIDGCLRHGWVYLDAEAFSGWNNITGAILHRPVLDALWGRDSTSPVLVLVARGLDDDICYRTWNGLVGWRDWEVVPDLKTTVGPSTTVIENKFYIVARGQNGKLYSCYKDLISGLWTPWTRLSRTCLSSPDLSAWN